MKIGITGHHVDITEGLTIAINGSLGKLSRHYPDIESIKTVLTVEKNEQTAEAIVHYLGQSLVVKASSDNLYHSITGLKSKVESVLKKRKTMIKSHATGKAGHFEEMITAEPDLELMH